MSNRIMDDQFYRTDGDAPGGWEGYAQLLQKYGRHSMRPEASRQMESEWEGRLTKQRHSRQLRWGIGFPTGIAVVTGVVFFFGSFGEETNEPLPSPTQTRKPAAVVKDHDIFANPAIPPVWYDSSMPAVDANLPGMGLDSGLFDLDSQIPSAIDSPVAGEPLQ